MSKPRALSLFTLAMISVATIGSVKNWPVIAEYGLSSIFLFLLAALLFFVPTALISAELATGWPEKGGVYLWVKEAFGHRTGFLAIWLQWVQNIFWYPTILAFIASTLAYAIDPSLANNKLYNLVLVLAIFWGATLANLQGMRLSGWISSAGTILGTFIPAGIIIILGAFWFSSEKILFSAQDLLPKLGKIEDLVFFTGIILCLMGMEMPAVHVKDVQNPQKSFPKAILLSTILILGLSIPGVLAIVFVVPQEEISLLSGSIQAFARVVNAYNLPWLTNILALLIGVGATASLSTWLVGPAKGLLAAAQAGDLPTSFRTLNKHEMPKGLLLFQGIVVSVVTFLFLFMPTLNAAFWFMLALTAQLYLVMYFLLFAAAIKLRYKRPHVARSYRVPGGTLGMWVCAGIGVLTSLFAFFIGFFPPSQVQIGNYFVSIFSLLGGFLLFCLGPYIILLFKK